MADDLSGFSMLELFRLEAEGQVAVLSAGVLAIEELEKSPETIEAMMRDGGTPLPRPSSIAAMPCPPRPAMRYS